MNTPSLGATEVMPTVAFAEAALSVARTAPRAVGLGSVGLAREMFYLATTDEVIRRAEISAFDVRKNQSAEDGVLTLDPKDYEVAMGNPALMAREFTDEAEIGRALELMTARLDDVGLRVLSELNQRLPADRAREWGRLGLNLAVSGLPLLAAPTLEQISSHVPLLLAGLYFGEAQRRRAREEKLGVPGLARHLRIIRYALNETAEIRRAQMHRIFTMVRGRVKVTPALHRALFERGTRELNPYEFRILVDGARALVGRWTDPPPQTTPTREILIESVVFTEATSGRLRWLIFYRADPPARGAGTAIPKSCGPNLVPVANR